MKTSMLILLINSSICFAAPKISHTTTPIFTPVSRFSTSYSNPATIISWGTKTTKYDETWQPPATTTGDKKRSSRSSTSSSTIIFRDDSVSPSTTSASASIHGPPPPPFVLSSSTTATRESSTTRHSTTTTTTRTTTSSRSSTKSTTTSTPTSTSPTRSNTSVFPTTTGASTPTNDCTGAGSYCHYTELEQADSSLASIIIKTDSCGNYADCACKARDACNRITSCRSYFTDSNKYYILSKDKTALYQAMTDAMDGSYAGVCTSSIRLSVFNRGCAGECSRPLSSTSSTRTTSSTFSRSTTRTSTHSETARVAPGMNYAMSPKSKGTNTSTTKQRTRTTTTQTSMTPALAPGRNFVMPARRSTTSTSKK